MLTQEKHGEIPDILYKYWFLWLSCTWFIL